HVTVAGGPVFYSDIVRLTSTDLRRAETVALPIAAIVLVLVFGSAVAAGVPLVIGGARVLVTLAFIALIAQFTQMSIFVLNVATMLGLGLGVDYALFVTNRFREEIEHGSSVESAVAATMATAGRAVFFSGLTVCVGLLALVSFDFMMLRTEGLAGSLVVFMTVIGAMTLLPAVLSVLGPRINALAVHLPAANVGRFWHALAYRVMARPVAVIVPVLAVLAVLGWPLQDIDLSSPDASILPSNVPSRQGFDELQKAFGPGALDPTIVVIKSSQPILSPDNVSQLYDFTHRLARDPRIARIDSVVTIDPRLTLAQYQLMYADPAAISDRYAAGIAANTTRGGTAMVDVISGYPSLSAESRGIVAEARELARQYPGWQVQVDGGAAEVTDVVDRLYSQFPLAILFITITTYVLLLLLLRSVVLPLKALLMNALSLIASYGALVWVFQEGHLSGLLHFAPLGFIEASLPIVMFCTLFGLSMDYEVFLLSRIKEAWEATGDNTRSVAEGLQSSGKIITSAALIVVCVSLSFVSADIVLIKALGLGVAVAVAVDATIVRALLVPATMRLLGKWNWYMPRLGGPVHPLLPQRERAG
ncbi:MAG: MMPL family transporter, partial [Chloroflexi bacterium]|nr:MMPL family transporter [Chloroflexota bacterium]